MKAFAKIAAALALALAASPAAAQREQDYAVDPTATPAIAAAVQECQSATMPERVDEARLIAGGWARAEASGGRRGRDENLHELRRDQMVLWLPQRESSCVVMARLQDSAQFEGVIGALAAFLGQPVRRPQGGVLWLQDSGAGVQADRSGSRDRPGIRIFILPAPAR
jgi:hypothetical protein